MENREKEERSLFSFFAILLTTLVLIVIGVVIHFSVTDTLDIAYIQATFNLPMKDFVAENAEKMQYYILTLLFPFIYFSFYNLFKRFVYFNNPKLLFQIVKFFQLGVVLVLALVLFGIEKSEFAGFCFWSFMPDVPAFMLIITFLFFNLLLYFELLGRYTKIIKVLLVCLTLYILVVVAWSNFMPLSLNELVTFHHFETYYYPIMKVYSGLTIGVDFHSFYGLYPYLFLPVLKIFGGPSVLKVTFISMILMLLSLLSVGYCLFSYVKNRTLFFISFISYIFIFFSVEHNYYLQFNPHRTLFLSLLIAVVTFLLNNPARKKTALCLGYTLCFFSVLWNFETAFIVNFVWCAVLIYLECLKCKTNELELYKNTFFKVLYSGLVLVGAFIAIYLITYFRTGIFLSLEKYFDIILLFSGSGFYMLKMPFWSHPWILVILTYMVAFSKSISEEDKTKGGMYFVLSLIGFGIFAYYQGRSHIFCLYAVIFPMFIILTILMREFLDKFLRSKSLVDFTKFYLLFAVLCNLTLSGYVACINPQIFKKFNKEVFYQLHLQYLPEIKEQIKQGRKVDIIAKNASVYYTELGAKDVLPFACVESLMTKFEYNKVFQWLSHTEHIVFMDDYILSFFKCYEPATIDLLNNRFTKLKVLDGGVFLELKH